LPSIGIPRDRESAIMEFLLLLGASLVATFYGVRFRIWWLVAVAAVLSLPFTLVAHIAYQVSWLLPFLQVAAAVALRWRVGAGGWLALLLTGLVVGLVGGPAAILVHRGYGRVLLIGLLVGFLALAWQQPPWVRVEQHSDGS
jgi:hypothetical protein